MAVASTPLVAAPSCPAWAKHRRGRQPQFDGKPCEPAEEEDMWLCLADGRARSTADLKRLATAARVRAKRAGDAAAANTRDRQARDQRRRQREQHDRRAAPAVAKTVRPQRGQCGCPAHAVCGMCVDQGKLAAAEQAAIDLETRFHASTNVVMDLEPTTSSYLERPEDETAALMQRCVCVEVWCRGCSVGTKKSDLAKELRVLIAAGASYIYALLRRGRGPQLSLSAHGD